VQLALAKKRVFARVADLYAALPAITGKLELEYEGELKGAETIARELIRTAIGRVFTKHFSDVNFQPVIQWFELGGELKIAELSTTEDRYRQLANIKDLLAHINRLGVTDAKNHAAASAAAEMILEGLWPIAASVGAKSAASSPTNPNNPNRAKRRLARRAGV